MVIGTSNAWSTVRELVLEALYLCGAYEPDETPELTYIMRGVKTLNAKLALYSSSSLYIPNYTNVQFELTQNKYAYTFSKTIEADIISPKFVSILSCVINRENSANPVTVIEQEQIDYHYRALNQRGLPACVSLTQDNQRSELRFYPTPNVNYQVTIRVKSVLENVTANDDLTFVPADYQFFILLDLAKILSSMNTDGAWTPILEEQLKEVKSKIMASNKISSVMKPPNDYPSPIVNGYNYYLWGSS